MSEGKQKPIGRCKAKFADGREQSFKSRNGEVMTGPRREIFTVWDNGDGRFGIRFESEVAATLVKFLGGKPGDRVYFDLFQENGGFAGGGTAADDGDDF